MRLQVLYCEDVRRELGNKASYMGVFGTILLAPAPSYRLEKLIVVASLNYPASIAEEITQMGVEVRLKRASGEVEVLQGLQPKPTNAASDRWFCEHVEADGFSAPELQTVGLIVLRNLLIDQACELQVQVETDLGTIVGNSLLLAPMPSQAGDDGSVVAPKAKKVRRTKKNSNRLPH